MSPAEVVEFRWANDARANGLPLPEELEALGFALVRRHPRWPQSWLMRRPETPPRENLLGRKP